MSEERRQQHVAPRSGRGTQLTPSQETTLINICASSRGEGRLSSHTKSFWKSLSAELFQSTGRVYSWQSCRRRMIAWELNELPPNDQNDDRREGSGSIEDVSSGRPRGSLCAIDGHESARRELPTDDDDRVVVPAPRDLPSGRDGDARRRAFANQRQTLVDNFGRVTPTRRRGGPDDVHQLDHAPTNAESADDDENLLPDTPVPLLQRNIHARCEKEKKAFRGELLPMFLKSMSALEAQIQWFASAILDDESDREGVLEACEDLKERVQLAIDRQTISTNLSRR